MRRLSLQRTYIQELPANKRDRNGSTPLGGQPGLDDNEPDVTLEGSKVGNTTKSK